MEPPIWHSSVEFSLDYMGFSTYRTGSRSLEGSLQFDAARPVLIKGSAVIAAGTRAGAAWQSAESRWPRPWMT